MLPRPDGAIMIDMVDVRTGQVLYRQHTAAPLAASQRRYEQVLGRRVAAMLDRLPAQGRGNG